MKWKQIWTSSFCVIVLQLVFEGGKSNQWNIIQGYLKGNNYWYVLKFNPRNLVYRRIYIKALPFVIQQSQHISHCLHKTQSTSLLSVCEKKIYICNAWYKWRQTLSNGIVSHCLNIHLLHSVIPNFLRIRRTKRRRNLSNGTQVQSNIKTLIKNDLMA